MVGRFKDAIINDICGERISDNIYLDGNRQLICSNCVLARTGTYDYRESELIDGGSDEKVVKVYRDESEVFDPVSMKSMNFKPLVNDHPDENVTPDTVRDLQKGFMTNVRKGEGEFDGCLIGDLVVTDPEVIDLILNNQKRDLSVGYTADIDEENGRYVMKNIRGNHIALCAAGRAGNARIRDSKTVVDSTYFASTGLVTSGGGFGSLLFLKTSASSKSEAEKKFANHLRGKSVGNRSPMAFESESAYGNYMGRTWGKGGKIEIADSVIADELDENYRDLSKKYSAIDQSGLSWSNDDNLSIVEMMARSNSTNGRTLSVVENKTGKTVAKYSNGKKLSDSALFDFEAKGSFDTIAELRSYYPGASVESRGREVIVRLLSGTKLLYTYLNGSDDKLLFIRRVTDSIRDGVEVLGDSHKLRVGQRVKYFGTPCVVTSIVPNIGSGEFLVEFGGGGQVCGSHSYDEVVTNINQGKIRLLDSVVFDSEAGEFKFEANDADDYATTGAGKLVANAMNELGIVSKKDLLSRKQEVIAKMQSMSSGYGRMQLGWFVENYAETELKDCDMNGDYSDSFKDKYADCFADTAGEMKSFRVSVGDRKFDTRAHSAAEAMAKVRAAVKDAMPKNFVMFRPSTGNYLQNGSSILNGQIYEGAGVWSAARFDKFPAEMLVKDLNNVMVKLGHKADWIIQEITPKDLGLEDSMMNDTAINCNKFEILAKESGANFHNISNTKKDGVTYMKFVSSAPEAEQERSVKWLRSVLEGQEGSGVLSWGMRGTSRGEMSVMIKDSINTQVC